MALLTLCGITIAIKENPLTLIMILGAIGIALLIGKYQSDRLIVLNISNGILEKKMKDGSNDLNETVMDYGEVRSIDFYKDFTFQHGGHCIIIEVNGNKKKTIKISNNWDQKKSEFVESVSKELMKLKAVGVKVNFQK